MTIFRGNDNPRRASRLTLLKYGLILLAMLSVGSALVWVFSLDML